ncbi:LacI family DNA-binding transcriptional regulator [Salinibacterium sp. PAMC 21357]|uniref:LacI family DNA-binding transcriptional regulator n=1 Tax=Salinibacterium sp. PAMC 21357 TaxID=1112215 RepID=UPI0002894614|nr:LacI family DNA-binding transcriptional regulator [Salinibacterium sp. PAMC 21357]
MEVHSSTIRDVARLADVSVATVSRVLANNYPVAAETRRRVLKAIDELNYVANTHARALAGSGKKTVAFILDNVRGAAFGDAAHGVEQEAARLGRLCIVGSTQADPARELEMLQLMREQQAEAVIVIGGVTDTEEYRTKMTAVASGMNARGAQLVLCGRPPLGPDTPVIVVESDNEGGAYAITSYLLAQGHRRVLMLAASEHHTTTAARVKGYQRALVDFGGEIDSTLLENGSFARSYGYERTEARIARGIDFTAIFAASDVVAAGAMSALADAGLDVPGDISVVGFDDIALASDLRPRLTTVHVPYEELGRLAVRTALEGNKPDEHIVLATHVVIRDSVAPPQKV